ncbi:MAG: hypothetical protein PHT78_10970, partial [Desulfitobacteriaceae bacterium]|nr:hypothetical protein [Desulfitobacteriaceae bacterium]
MLKSNPEERNPLRIRLIIIAWIYPTQNSFLFIQRKERYAKLNIDKHLILIKGEDKTESISRCTYANGKWHVVFAKDKTYSYNYNN